MHATYAIAVVLSDSGSAVVTTSAELIRTWSWPALPGVSLIVVTGLYLRGWAIACKTRPGELPAWRAVCYLSGIASLWIAIASPIDAFDDYLLAAHMIQHFILMSVAPPLLILGNPTVPLLRALPKWIVRRPIGWFFRNRIVQRVSHFLMHPGVIWVAMNALFLGWHAPRAFELTFRSENWHNLEHLTFFLTSVAFWFVVLQPWPSKQRWPRWTVIPYLLSADIINTILSALLTFSGRVLYPTYEHAQRICALTPLQDQIAAGSEMWVLNSTVFVIPAVVLTLRLLSPRIRSGKRISGTGSIVTAVMPGQDQPRPSGRLS